MSRIDVIRARIGRKTVEPYKPKGLHATQHPDQASPPRKKAAPYTAQPRHLTQPVAYRAPVIHGKRWDRKPEEREWRPEHRHTEHPLEVIARKLKRGWQR